LSVVGRWVTFTVVVVVQGRDEQGVVVLGEVKLHGKDVHGVVAVDTLDGVGVTVSFDFNIVFEVELQVKILCAFVVVVLLAFTTGINVDGHGKDKQGVLVFEESVDVDVKLQGKDVNRVVAVDTLVGGGVVVLFDFIVVFDVDL
jgi:hypothetical protein